MASASRRYTAEFKAGAVEVYKAAGPDVTYAEIARELGVGTGSLAHWVKFASDGQPDDPEMNPFQMREQNRRLKRELARIKEENEILLKPAPSSRASSCEGGEVRVHGPAP